MVYSSSSYVIQDKLQVKHKEESNEQLTGGNIRSNEGVVQKRGWSNIYGGPTTVKKTDCYHSSDKGMQWVYDQKDKGFKSPECSR
jgi:hypothetical protein